MRIHRDSVGTLFKTKACMRKLKRWFGAQKSLDSKTRFQLQQTIASGGKFKSLFKQLRHNLNTTNPAVTKSTIREDAGENVKGIWGRLRRDPDEQECVGIEFGDGEVEEGDGEDEEEEEEEDEEEDEEEERGGEEHEEDEEEEEEEEKEGRGGA